MPATLTADEQADTDEDACLGCENMDDPHDCGFENGDCPEQCSIDHEVDREVIITCPQAGRRWRWCDLCGWEQVGSLCVADPMWIEGPDVLVCDPAEHGYYGCENCGDYVHEDYANHYRGQSLCDYCYEDCEHYPTSEGEGLLTCSTCETTNHHLDMATELFLCDCKAEARHLARQPVLFRDRPNASYIAAVKAGEPVLLKEAA